MKTSVGYIGVAILCIALFTGCFCLSTGNSTFSAAITAQLDDAIAKQKEALKLPGVVVGIWTPGEGYYLSATGDANLATGERRCLCEPFRIASITKTFTATAVLRLVDKGVLSTSDPLSDYLPDFPNADKIRIHDLLWMRSGIPDFADEEYLQYLYDNPLVEVSASEEIARSAALTDRFEEPNQKTVYSNVNYTILGEIVRLATGKDIGETITTEVLEPLGLHHTSYPDDTALPGRLHGYSWNADANDFDDMTVLNPLWAGAGGGMISTLHDLKVFARALYKGDLLSEATQAERLECMPFDFANGLMQYGEGIAKLGKFWGHDGTIFGFSTEMWYLPEKDAVIVVNVNRLDEDDNSKSQKIFAEVAKIVFPDYVDW